MEEFDIKPKDIISQIAVDKSSLSLYLSGKVKMNKLVKSCFFYYFLAYELNRDLRPVITEDLDLIIAEEKSKSSQTDEIQSKISISVANIIRTPEEFEKFKELNREELATLKHIVTEPKIKLEKVDHEIFNQTIKLLKHNVTEPKS
jgi:hypothetical protein